MGLDNFSLWLGGNRPTLDLSFMGAMPSQLSFSRASSGTVWTADKSLPLVSDNVPRFDHDPVTGAPLGLLMEESRTNLLQQSDTICAAPWGSFSMTCSMGSSLAPDGSYSGTDITASSVSASVSQQVSASASTTYTFSVWIKRISGASNIALRCYDGYTVINSSVLFSGSAWERHSMTVTTGASATYLKVYVIDLSSSGWGTYSIWRAQLEAGSMSSSIPTTTAAATRAVDILYGSLGPWFNPAQGTFFLSGTMLSRATNGNNHLAVLSDGTLSNMISFYIAGDSGTPLMCQRISDAETTSAGELSVIGDGNHFKLAASYSTGQHRLACNGVLDGAGTIDAAGVPSSLVQLNLTNRAGGSFQPSLLLERFVYHPRILQPAELQRITAS